MFMLGSGILLAQLKEFQIAPFPDVPASNIVQANATFSDNAIILVYTSLPDLNFRSSMNGINQVNWNPTANRYQILVNPVRQILFVFGRGYIEGSLGVISPQPKDVLSFKVEEKLLARTEGKGTLIISTTPAGASLTINGIETAYRTPVTREFNAGDLDFSFNLPGYLPTDTLIRVSPGSKTFLTVSMRPSWADLLIELQPPQAEVTIDGKRYWAASNNGRIELSGLEAGLKPGVHELIASLDKHRTVTRRIPLSAGDRRVETIRLEPILGTISVSSDPSAADVWINGRQEGITPFERRLPVGEYRITVKKQGHKEQERLVVLKENATERMVAELPNYSRILKPLQVKSGITLALGLAGLGAGGYFLYTGGADYKAYQNATTNADALRKRVQFADTMYPVAFAVGGTALLTSILFRSKTNKFKRDWGLVLAPSNNGSMLAITHRIGQNIGHP